MGETPSGLSIVLYNMRKKQGLKRNIQNASVTLIPQGYINVSRKGKGGKEHCALQEQFAT